MNPSVLFELTEWDWFKLQLRLHALERRSPLFNVHFTFDDNQMVVICEIHNGRMVDILRETADTALLLEEYFNGWMALERKVVESVLSRLPALAGGFSIFTDLKFEIFSDYGTGSVWVCRISADGVTWNRIFLDAFSEPNG